MTGFLGSGKTSFINHLLTQNPSLKTGLIENEFGEVSIDSRLISNYQPESIIELSNGCICCNIFNEFSLTLQELVKKHDQLELLLIETTGVANPGPVISPFYQDADLIRLFELIGTVCLVDAAHFLEYGDGEVQQRQLILSDLIIINKIEEVDQPTLAKVRKKITALNQTARIAETNYAQIDQAQFYLFQSLIQEDFLRKLRKPFFSEPDTTIFHSFTIRFNGLVNEAQFTDWFRYFASLHNNEVFRIKGIVHFKGNPLIAIVQSVGGMVHIVEGSVINPFEPLENILVFIGKEVSKFELEKEIKQFLVQER